jgi:hypothetical protein
MIEGILKKHIQICIFGTLYANTEEKYAYGSSTNVNTCIVWDVFAEKVQMNCRL